MLTHQSFSGLSVVKIKIRIKKAKIKITNKTEIIKPVTETPLEIDRALIVVDLTNNSNAYFVPQYKS